MFMHSRWVGVACGGVGVALLLVGVGCGGADKPVPVRGTVTLDGKPVEGALVLFIPAGGTGREANGQTGADGSFQLTTRNTHDGALAGEYKVVVQYSEGTAEAPPGGNVKDVMLAMEKAQKTKPPPPKYVIPARYSDRAKTELRQVVPTDGPVTLALVSR